MNTKGSIWRKWDLHIHTPYSILNNGFGVNFDEYVKGLFKSAIANEIAVIGITDYFSIEGYKKIKQDYLDKSEVLEVLFNPDEINKIKDITVLPNIEFRLNKLVGSNRINFHVIFSEKISIKDIEENFLHEIEFVSEGNPQSPDEKWKLKIDNLSELGKRLKAQHSKFRDRLDLQIGMSNAVVDDSQIIEILTKRNTFKNMFLFVLPGDEDLSKISWDSQDHLTRKALIQKSDMLLSSNPNTINWSLGRKDLNKKSFLKEFKSLKPAIWGSDAHEYSRLFKPDNDRNLWIKANINFQGLKQLLYEPDLRVRIQKSNPIEDYDKSFFNEIQIKSDLRIFENDNLKFKKVNIPLNRDMVSIIGGRGTGKSVLINYFANGFKYYNGSHEYLLNNKFEVEYIKEGSESVSFNFESKHDLGFIFISQNEIIRIADNPKELSNEIRKTLGVDKLAFSPKIDEQIETIIRNVNTYQNWFLKRNEETQLINDRRTTEEEITRYENFIKTVTTEQNREKLEQYSRHIKRIQDLKLTNEAVTNTISELKEFLELMNQKLLRIDSSIPKIEFFGQFWELEKIFKNNTLEINKIENDNAEIKSRFSEYKGDLTSLLENVEKYQALIENLKNKLVTISEYETKLISAQRDKINIGNLLYEELTRQKSTIDEAWLKIKSGRSDWSAEQVELMKKILNDRNIEINGEIVFNKTKFYELLKEYLNGRSFKRKNDEAALEDFFEIRDFDTFIDFVNTKLSALKIENPNYFFENSDYEIDNLIYKLTNRSSYLSVVPKITYNLKPLSKISAGQRGTIYLCLKLATSAFSQPIIYDQPEDDLDNDFIIKELILIFKELKQYRQIIIVTHNANLVVNTDSEQVIVANNLDESLQYESGALEDESIIEHVCRILEGGKDAFMQRESRYKLIE
jgi:ABC-type lipoprotein export system ATPase subunit